MKDNPDEFKRFYTRVNGNNEIEVLFTYSNFMDLIKRDEQDAIAKVVANTADSYLPPLPDDGKEYPVTENPIGLIPDSTSQQELRDLTASYNKEVTLRTMFRHLDFNPPSYDFGDQLHKYRSIVDEHGIEGLKAIAFEDYLEIGDDNKYHLDQNNIDIIEFVRNISLVYRIDKLDPNENPKPNDMNDLALCASAIICECSIFAIEEKWVNVGIVGNMISDLLNEQSMNVVTSYEGLLQAIESH